MCKLVHNYFIYDLHTARISTKFNDCMCMLAQFYFGLLTVSLFLFLTSCSYSETKLCRDQGLKMVNLAIKALADKVICFIVKF